MTLALFWSLACAGYGDSVSPDSLNAPASSTNALAAATAITNAVPENPPNLATASSPGTSADKLRESLSLLGQKKFDQALNKVNEAIQSDPQSADAYVVRGNVYSALKAWDKAEADFNLALQMDGTKAVAKFNLAETQFIQKKYDQARGLYSQLTHDPDNGDYAAYKVFLCDLFASHQDAADKELAAFNAVGSNASYYFGNAAWDLFNHKNDDASQFLSSGSHIYSRRKIRLYTASLFDLGYLPVSQAIPAQVQDNDPSKPDAH